MTVGSPALAGTRITLAAATYTNITTQFEAAGNKVDVLTQLADLSVGLVTSGETPSALPEVAGEGGSVTIIKPLESTLDVYAHSTVGGNIYLVGKKDEVIFDTTGTTSA